MAKQSAAKPEPAWIRHSRAFYKYLDDRSVEDEDGNRVASVYLTAALSELGISPPMRAKVYKVIYESNPPCAVAVVRGGGGKPSVIYLLHPPSEGDFENALTDAIPSDTVSPVAEEIAKRLERLEASTTGLNIVEALRNHEQRIATLEGSAGLATNQERDTNGTD